MSVEPTRDGRSPRPEIGRLRLTDADRATASSRPGKGWWALGGGLCVVLALALAIAARGCSQGSRTSEPTVPASPGSNTTSNSPSSSLSGAPATAPPATAPEAIMAGGRVEAAGRRELSVARPGVVAAVHVARGARVKAGSVLLELDASVERATVAERQAASEAARARLQELRDGSRPEEVDQARREAEAAQAFAADALEKASRAEHLARSGAATSAQVAEATRAAEAAQARLAAARARVALLERGARRTALLAAEAEAARASAALEAARAQLAATRILAPVDGTVLEVRTRTGEAVAPERVAPLVLADLDRLVVVTDVPEGKAVHVHAGDPAEIVVEALPGRRFHGKVTEVSLEADRQKGTLEVTVSLDDPGPAVRPRMAARVTITPREKERQEER